MTLARIRICSPPEKRFPISCLCMFRANKTHNTPIRSSLHFSSSSSSSSSVGCFVIITRARILMTVMMTMAMIMRTSFSQFPSHLHFCLLLVTEEADNVMDKNYSSSSFLTVVVHYSNTHARTQQGRNIQTKS